MLARYNSVNATAQQVAQTPFQTYSSNPNDFVAPLNATQNAGIANTNTYANSAQPYYGAATSQLLNAQSATQPYLSGATAATIGAAGTGQNYTNIASGLAGAAAGPVNAGPLGAAQIGQYLSPYLSTVLGSTSALLNQNNQQAMSGQLGNAISQGAFGGDRGGIAAANLNQQQNLANANIYSNIANQGYNNALSAAQQQQGVNLSAEQANRAALAGAAGEFQSLGQQGYAQGLGTAQELGNIGQQTYATGANTASSLAGLGSAAQTAGLQGAQAQTATSGDVIGRNICDRAVPSRKISAI